MILHNLIRFIIYGEDKNKLKEKDIHIGMSILQNSICENINEINYTLQYIVENFNKNKHTVFYCKDEYTKIAIILEHCVVRFINHNKNIRNIIETIYLNPHKNLEQIIYYFSLGTSFCYISERYSQKYKIKKYIKSHILDGLNHLHNLGFYHGDVSLDNIVYCEKTNNYKLVDFDLSFKHCQNKNEIIRKSVRELL